MSSGWFSRAFFRGAYLFGFKPWDSGVPPPELVEVIEGPHRLPAGRALDLGCGTGTTAVYMARHGWQVTGVDFVPQAIAAANKKAAAASVSVQFLRGDVTRLADLVVEPGFDLLFDQGCFHSLNPQAQAAYVAEATRMTKPGALYLLYAFGPSAGGQRRRYMPSGLTPEEVARHFSGFRLLEARPGTDPFNSHWYRLERGS